MAEAASPGFLGIRSSWRASPFHGTVRPLLWLLIGVSLSHAYVNGLLFPDHWTVAPLPLFAPQAVVLSVLVLTQTRLWWLLLFTYYVVQVVVGALVGLPLWYGMLSNVANVLEPLVGAALYRRFAWRPVPFASIESVALYVGAVTLGALVGASWGATARMLAGASFMQSWAGWFLGDILASLALAPTIILWVAAGRKALPFHSPARFGEAAFLSVTLLLIGTLVFGMRASDPDLAPALLFLPVPVLVWVAVRFGPLGLTTAISLLTVLAIAGATMGLGPFVGRSISTNLVTLQLFVLSIGAPLLCLAALVQEREQAQAELQQSENRYRAVVSNFPRGVVLLFGPDLRHRFADGEGLKELGLSKRAVEGRTLWESVPPTLASLLEGHYQAALVGNHATFELAHAERIYHVDVLPLSSSSESAGMVLMQDITEERRAEVLAAANEQLEQLNRAKSDFVSVVSHEFRTPLTGIQAFSELMRDEDFSPGQIKEFAADINSEAERLGRMIGELLDLDRMESGRMTLNVESLDLNALIEEAVATNRLYTLSHPIELDLEPNLASVSGDRDKVTQVVLNLLTNAIKYSPGGSAVTVTTESNPGMAHLSVRDEGVGIPAEALEAVFDRYVRLESAADSGRGTGLGLPIVRQITELHGGKVWVESELGAGSTFHVILPLGSSAG
jgi:two-component system, LuxR family, sensor kinase FixL